MRTKETMEKQNKCVSCRDELIYYLRNIAVFFSKTCFIFKCGSAYWGARKLLDRQTDRQT